MQAREIDWDDIFIEESDFLRFRRHTVFELWQAPCKNRLRTRAFPRVPPA